MREEVPGEAFFYHHLRALLIFEEGAMSSSESHVSSALGILVQVVPETGLQREVRICVGLFSVCDSG